MVIVAIHLKFVFAEVLENDPEQAVQIRRVVFPDIVTVEKDTAFGRIVKTGQKLDERGGHRDDGKRCETFGTAYRCQIL